MEREKLLQEHKATLESLIEKTKFCYSEEFYTLDDFEKQKYTKDKMATEGHLNTLSTLLWAKVPQLSSATDLFALGILSSMFNVGSFGATPPMPKLDEKDFETAEAENKDE